MKQLQDLFVPYDLAVKIKQKGFNEECLKFYGDDKKLYQDDNITNSTVNPDYCSAPLYEQIINWLDDVHKIRVDLTHSNSNGAYKYSIWKWNFDNNAGNWEKADYINSFVDKNERTTKAIESALKLI